MKNSHDPHSTANSRQEHKKDQRHRKRAKQKLKRQIAEQQDTALLYEMRTTIAHPFPDWLDQLRENARRSND